jgi:hypothetical protein
MALASQDSKQILHLLHLCWSMTWGFPSVPDMACCGHSLAHD